MAEISKISEGQPLFELSGGVAVRPYRDSDVKSTSRHANNKNVTKYLRARFPDPYTEEKAKEWFDFCAHPDNLVRSGPWTLAGGSQGPPIPVNYAITVNDEAVGSIGLDFGSDVYFRTAELGYWLGEEHWGKGIMTKVATAFVDWAWKTFGVLARLNSGAVELNVGSPKVLEKAGFVYEGRRENLAFKDGQLFTEVMYGALRPAGSEPM